MTTLTNFTLLRDRFENQALESRPKTTATIEAEVEYWEENAGKIASAQAFLDDDRLYNFVTKAFGYGDNPPDKALILISLEQGAENETSNANRTPDYRLESLVRNLSFEEFGLSRVRDTAFVEQVSARYRVEATKEDSANSRPTTRAEIETEYFKTKIGGVESPADLLSDFRLYSYALKAFGLEDRLNQRFLVEQALIDGTTDDTDLVNHIDDPKLTRLVQSFGFGDVGLDYVQNENFGESVARRYEQVITATQAGGSTSNLDDSEYFRAKIGQVENTEQLFDDPRLTRYIITAFDLDISEPTTTAFLKRALEEGASDRADFANVFPDPRYQNAARTLGIAEFGSRNLQDPFIVDSIVNRFERVNAENEAGQENPTVQFAAYFDRKGGDITNWFQVIADGSLREVVFTALNVPQQVLGLDLSRQVSELEERFDIGDFADPEKREDLLRRYIVLSDQENGTTPGATNTALQLLTGASTGLFGVGQVNGNSLLNFV